MISNKLDKNGLSPDRFWFRANGLSWKFTKIRLYDQLSSGEKLLACILRDDTAAACLILQNQPVQMVFDELLQLILKNQFARLVLDRLFEAELLQFLPQDLRQKLTVLAMEETAFQKLVGKRFAELLEAVSKLNSHHLWIKGVSLSRMVYSDINHRHYGDLDLVVRREKIIETVEAFVKLGFELHISPAFCNQVGVGPVASATDLLLSPHSELVQTSAVCLYKADWPMIDIKFAPFDRGIQMIEFERLFEDAITLTCGAQQFFAPSVVDHLMISVHNLEKDRSINWKNLYDIHLLATKLNDDPLLWYQFVCRSIEESIDMSAWLGLSLAVDRFCTPVPDVVLTKLRQKKPLWMQQVALAVSPFFVWNATSLPMLLSNACVSSDFSRKFEIIAKSFYPSRQFLSAYYNENRQITNLNVLPILIRHWFVLFLPGGLVRMVMGHMWTKTQKQPSVIRKKEAALVEVG